MTFTQKGHSVSERVRRLEQDYNRLPALESTESDITLPPIESDPFLGKDAVSILEPFQRRCFFARGRIWVFYSDTIGYGYRTSTDAIHWSSVIVAAPYNPGGGYARHFVVWVESNNDIHICWNPWGGLGTSLYYRKGALNIDGTISWYAIAQTVITPGRSEAIDRPYLSVDSNGCPWIGYLHWGTHCYPKIIKSSTKNGIWTTEGGFPQTLSSGDSSEWAVSCIPLTGGMMYLLYGVDYPSGSLRKLMGRLYSGSLGAEETVVPHDDLWYNTGYSAVAIGDTVHCLYTHTDGGIRYRQRTLVGGWEPEQIIEAGIYAHPVTTKVDAKIYVFWIRNVSGTWKIYKSDIITAPSIIVPSAGTLWDTERISSYYTVTDGVIGLIWINTGWQIKHKVIT